ncbi:N-acetylglucosaminyldiphosphoundecaprenol N-acetyl-beta-D-mannosaminyltransferase [Emticicia aquatica]|uniref:N-acetylglucosaminyldiphosphoundecaprenol N-acetyl-beta-D-mannosaminyltransferase n=1 Tax=Emticicia aquatica TaxID=1681835 RepID=A0ABM9AS28_9BACT|nr:WecB/TagA/CpsF family glycosyltransferase [Emticicia aquatica]CAH0996748.1 N-acetylglucosaminyldiphosphoundecaprenol N-acetyl-beta-D-mannosaminyltransferase [Emticicia aquatica]
MNVKILDIQIYSLTIEKAIREILCDINNSKNRLVSATGAHGLIETTKNNDFRHILKSFYMNLPDGMPSVWVGRMKGATEMQRCYGPDFFAEMMLATHDKPIKHFFCGGNDGVADMLKHSCGIKFLNQNICGTYCPPFLAIDKYNYPEIANYINDSKADIVWIGLSTPKQEQFAYNLSKYTNVGTIICVGAAFDFHTGRVKQAPKWMQKRGLEWFFRLIVEPKRLYQRYLEIVPKFIYYNVLDFLGFFKPNR